MSAHPNQTKNHWSRGAIRFARATGQILAGVVCVVGVVSFVLWDTDHYAARIKVERFKTAWFGDDWLDETALLPEPATDIGLIATLNKVKGLTLFLQSIVEPTGLIVTTGASFTSSENLITGNAERSWCYLTIGSGQVSKRLTLANQKGDDEPVFQVFDDISENELAQAGLAANELSLIAHKHCRFGGFSQITQNKF